ncbi:hypothetical protein BKA67DRAFT_86795 [Truncatella angustata]|uniref:Glutamyl-tRNA amidotransferase complex subunit Gta3 domain-containing protein n=1 Tax=Truncatella angustata TaxID=152316 RepID=A0A9P8UBT2_9PEZI|nr:uncharacterized protein BKA67DRAFT_86795 [Truncatella angustata]KAH6645816.1 hypothetical protein BKA67DRAFT_86795 [Truncatella angustata]KAH8202014.1 hypothetical protein TruAng_003857 [Truncatella angustata]
MNTTMTTTTTTICAACRASTRRQAFRSPRRAFQTAAPKTAHPTPAEILSRPTWSVRSLLPPPSSPSSTTPSQQSQPNRKQEEEEEKEEEDEEITPSTLLHLLRLSALPPPSSPEEQSQLLGTLRSQLHFVRNIQSIDTTGVTPLVSIRDETAEGVREQTVGLETLREALGEEHVIGHNKRPRRRRGEGNRVQIKGVEDWDVLKGASEKAGRYFVVRSAPAK